LELYEKAEKSLAKVYGNQDLPIPESLRELGVSIPSIIHFGSWIGGDRDGNNTLLHTLLHMSCAVC
jgi:phosphoenolpyruvate carboxylase